MFTFTILYHDAEIAWAEAERFEDARQQAIQDAGNGFYNGALRNCTFSAVSDRGVVRQITGPLFV